MPNDVKLQEGHPVDENLRPIKVGGKSTALETAQHGNGARVNGDLEVTGDFNIFNKGDIILDASGENITMKSGNVASGLDFVQHHQGDWDIKNLTQDQSITIVVNDGGSEVDIISIDGEEPYVQFPNSSVGFSRKEATFSTTGVVGSAGTDDTDIDFRTGNKFRL